MSENLKLPETPQEHSDRLFEMETQIRGNILLYFESHEYIKNGKNYREIVNVCYINQVNAVEKRRNQFEVEFIPIEYDGFYYKMLKFEGLETVMAVYLDEQKFLDYLESIHFPHDESLIKVEDQLQMLVNVVISSNLAFLSEALTNIINTKILRKPLENIQSLKLMRELLTDKGLELTHLVPYKKPLEMDSVFPSLPKIIR